MRERNARLLRKFVRFCGPERLPETIEEGGAVHRNPIIRDFESVFNAGTAGQKRALVSQMRQEMVGPIDWDKAR
jgi:hypothetical protein